MREIYLERKLNMAYLSKKWVRVVYYRILLKIERWKNG